MDTVITLTTDFGLKDAYVAAMKGVILGINRSARLVDICHTIEPQNILQAAFILSTAYRFFPEKTIHIVVVDPGVGSERKAIILKTPTAYFVAPDNGVLSYVIQEYSDKATTDITHLQPTELGRGLEAVSITNSGYWRPLVSATFHGRDIFAPVAAWLSLGTVPIEFGERINSLTVLPLPHPYQQPDGSMVAHIIHIDGFGNLITDMKSNSLPGDKQSITIEVAGHHITGLSRTYSDGEGLLALIGSSGYLEISLKEGNAHHFLNARVGDEVRINY